MISETTLILSIVGAVFASTGFWAFLTSMIQRKDRKDGADTEMLKGLGHDRICYLGSCFIKQGYITKNDADHTKALTWRPTVTEYWQDAST